MSRTAASAVSALRARRFAAISSIDFASHTVQVITEASTSAISTPFTSESAVRYMPQGDRSRGSSAVAVCAGAVSGAISRIVNAVRASAQARRRNPDHRIARPARPVRASRASGPFHE
jgi:hypothetical protein